MLLPARAALNAWAVHGRQTRVSGLNTAAVTHFANAIGAARSGQIDRARAAVVALDPEAAR